MNTEFRKYIKAVGTGPKLSRDLTVEEAERAFRLILEGEASDAQIGGILVPLRMKIESPDELASFVRVTRDFCRHIQTDLPHLVDCGVAYDGKVKFPHITPLAAFVAAGAGASVFLHGQSMTPPKYGVSIRDVFMELGMAVDWPLEKVKNALEETGVGFASIEHISPRVAELKRIREELGLRTAFNHIEKLWNPTHAPHQVISIYHGPYLETVPKVLQKTGTAHALVVQGMEGSPDIRLSRPTKMSELKNGQIDNLFLLPSDLGFKDMQEPVYEGFTAKENAQIINQTLSEAKGVWADLAVLNAALLIYASGQAGRFDEGVEKARESLFSRQALNKLQSLRRMAQSIFIS